MVTVFSEMCSRRDGRCHFVRFALGGRTLASISSVPCFSLDQTDDEDDIPEIGVDASNLPDAGEFLKQTS